MEKFTTTVSGGPRWAALGRSGSPDAAAVWRSSNTTVGATRSVNRPSKRSASATAPPSTMAAMARRQRAAKQLGGGRQLATTVVQAEKLEIGICAFLPALRAELAKDAVDLEPRPPRGSIANSKYEVVGEVIGDVLRAVIGMAAARAGPAEPPPPPVEAADVTIAEPSPEELSAASTTLAAHLAPPPLPWADPEGDSAVVLQAVQRGRMARKAGSWTSVPAFTEEERAAVRGRARRSIIAIEDHVPLPSPPVITEPGFVGLKGVTTRADFVAALGPWTTPTTVIEDIVDEWQQPTGAWTASFASKEQAEQAAAAINEARRVRREDLELEGAAPLSLKDLTLKGFGDLTPKAEVWAYTLHAEQAVAALNEATAELTAELTAEVRDEVIAEVTNALLVDAALRNTVSHAIANVTAKIAARAAPLAVHAM